MGSKQVTSKNGLNDVLGINVASSESPEVTKKRPSGEILRRKES
jgi:hypothetical protein